MGRESERQAWLRLALAQGVGRPWARRAIQALGSPQLAAYADPRTLACHMPAGRARALGAALRRAQPERIERRAVDLGQCVLTPADDRWPASALEGLVEAPLALFLRGRLPAAGEPAAALVGTREASPYGRQVALRLAADLAAHDVWVVSGFALGIDGAAHGAAVKAGGRSLAVLGCGVDYDYPVAHGDLRAALLERGGLVSEHPPGDEPRPHHFPRRNRLVAALSGATVVVEAPMRSGALNTVAHALAQSRPVLAVPGGIFRTSHAGCLHLLRDGAILCTEAADILLALGMTGADGGAAPRPPPTVGDEAVLWRALDDEEAVDASALCMRTGLDAEAVTVALTNLEIDGRVRRMPGVGFLRRRG